jgi:choline dehydrogenase
MSGAYDYIVVGGGGAGCIVAARLSQDSTISVLLLEAGHDYRGEETPHEVLDVKTVPMRGHAEQFMPEHDWGLVAHSRGSAGINVPQGRLIGGSSAINGAISLRGARADYDEWVGFGNPEWSWEKVLPTFVAMENDPEPGDFHGHDGPIPLARATQDELAPIQAAFVESAKAIGTPYVYDLNAPDAHGVGPAPMTRIGDRRVSTAQSYLAPARARANLTVRGDSLVDRVLFDGTRATGVVLADGTTVEAKREVVLCGGAIQTPAILQRSGIGRIDLLNQLGIKQVVDLPSGENLGDHFNVPLMAQPKPGVWQPGQYGLQTVLRTSTTVQPGSLDGQLTTFTYLSTKTTGDGNRGLAGEGNEDVDYVCGMGCVLNKPRSLGTIRITSTDPSALPDVDPNYLHEQIDRDAIREIVRLAWRVFTSPPMADMINDALGFDDEIMADDAKLDEVIESKAASGYHFTGTALMAPLDGRGVVDQQGLVHGTTGLRVADASVIPTTPAANSQLTTFMTAERIAAMTIAGTERIDVPLAASARIQGPR